MIQLVDNELGTLPLTCESGYVVTSFQIGSPEARPVERNRALQDGGIDDTTFVGCRAVSVSLMLDTRVDSMQALLDRVLPYMSPRRRPDLMYSLPGSDTLVRSYMVRGVDWPLQITRPKHPTVVLQWKTCDPFALSPETECFTMQPSSATEAGRAYNLTFPRTYPAGAPTGSFEVVNAGNAPAEWTATIFGPITNPTLNVNGVDMTFDQNGGVVVLAGQTLIVDTKERTIWLNGDPASSRYGFTNFNAWGWDDVRFGPGVNLTRLTGTATDSATALTVCWRSAWL